MTSHPVFPDQLNLADYCLFDRLREGNGGRTALRFGERSWTYAEVAERSTALARYLTEVGVAREHRVYIVLPDAPPFAWSLFGVLAHGGVVAMGNPHAPPADLEYVVHYSRAAALVTTPEVAAALAPVLLRSPYLRAVLLVPDVPTGGDAEAEPEVPRELGGARFPVVALSRAIGDGRRSQAELLPTHRDDVCFWLFTSGSTGKPKANVHTHRDFAFNTEVYAKGTVGYRADDVTVSVPRLFFGYATGTNLFFPFAVGACAALFPERPTPESVADAIALYRPTVVTNVPTMMGKLLDHDDERARRGQARIDMSSIRFQLSAGEALPPALLERFMARFGCDVYDGIGSAEMFHIYATNRPGDIRPGSLGRAVDGYEIRILDQDAPGPGAPPLPDGETGVMWVRGDSVSLGYFQDRDKSWQTFHGHWCRTGDLFRIDADGYLWFSGRADDLFKAGGVFVAPVEVEDCLIQHAAVGLAAVVPIEREGLIKPKAYVVVRDAERARAATDAGRAALAAELEEHCVGRLSRHKVPRSFVFVDDLPKNDRGKIDRRALVRLEADGRAGEKS
ncbi:MAG TPA: benzoate-CoA ligase family protein [Kofleriaceae bacterium]|nr:benzoate-CoA ligase family protein [Kofleriaceae bacterium]